jgi:hypothetical protein
MAVMAEVLRVRSDVVKALDSRLLAWDSSKYRPPGLYDEPISVRKIRVCFCAHFPFGIISRRPMQLPSQDVSIKTSARCLRNMFSPLLLNGSEILRKAACNALMKKAATGT